MKSKLLILVAFWVFSITTYAQDQSGHKGAVLTGGAVFSNENLSIQFQIGAQFQYPINVNSKIKTGFPFGVYYALNTFSEENFEVSKGYYEDNIQIKWSIGANEDNIEKFEIYRKRYNTQDPVQKIATLGKDVFEFQDGEVEGGVLYEYTVRAIGVSELEQKYLTYIDGIGYRNPTAFVSGSISFKGGSPVQDVTVFADPVGAETTPVGKSIHITDRNEKLILANEFTDVDAEKLTFQGWFAPQISANGFHELLDFTLSGNKYSIDCYLQGSGDGKYLRLGVWDWSSNVYLFLHTLNRSFPTGEINARGEDVFANIKDITDTTFLHVSLVIEPNKAPLFYLNGREFTSEYFNDITVGDDVLTPSFQIYNRTDGNTVSGNKITSFSTGNSFTGYIDEIRVWKRALTKAEIRRDYKRYIDGSETGLLMYNRMDEGTGNFAYDLSKTGFNFHKNDLIKSVFNSSNIQFSDIVPTKDQLGIYGITDEDGSYAISAIPYKGSGEQFKITPSFGVHKFNPASQTLFLGKEESVVNNLDFEDISSFQFNGRVVYDARGVFSPIDITDPQLQNITSIRENGYNQYLVNGTITINKGQYFYEGGSVDENSGNLVGGELKRYPVIGVEEANLYIDDKIVLDEDNQPVATDFDGKFSIRVPIGRHKVEVKKNGHVFALNGRFPEKTENTETNLFDFYEDQIQERWFVDETRVTVVGRVVGGRIESEKEIGFGFNGLKTHENTVDEGEASSTEIISSTNNIGSATITFKGDLDTDDLNYVFSTNSESGEYRIELIPYIYHIKQGDIKVNSNPEINSEFLDANETLDFTEVKEEEFSTFTAQDETEYISEPYQYVKNFRYNSKVTLKLLEQEYEKEYEFKNAEGETIVYDVSEMEAPLYKMAKKYRMVFEVTQDYINYDNNQEKVVKEYYNEGLFNITNNLANQEPSTYSINLIKVGNIEQYLYSFQGGSPNFTYDANNIQNSFQKTINIEYTIPGSDLVQIDNIEDFKEKGIVIGSVKADGTTFVTQAPTVPDIILRDPPGTNSFASIEKGTSISFETAIGSSNGATEGGGVYISVGPKVTIASGTPVLKTDAEAEVVLNTELNFSKSQTLNSNGSTTETYTFNETISTSDDFEFVGAGGDLYIGNSKNVFYGIVDKMFIGNTASVGNNSNSPSLPITVKDKNGVETIIYISSGQDFMFAEQPTETFFIYSQRYILETLIPNLLKLQDDAPENVDVTSATGIQSKNFYKEQINLWKLIIQDNERDKYLALSDRDKLKVSITKKIDSLESEKNKRIAELKEYPITMQRDYSAELINLDNHIDKLEKIYDEHFFSNKSFDAGVGEFTTSITTSVVNTKTYEKTIDLSKDFQQQIGALFNNVGAVGTYATSQSEVSTNSSSITEELTTTFSYTLKDNDDYNAISVDVINAFDGNGPIFVTKGGATSCPNEGVEKSEFYKHSEYLADPKKPGSGGENLSEGTIEVYRPEISVNKSLITNLPESEDAVFTLILKNTSATGSDLEHRLYVDPTTLNGATSNLNQNGINIFLPFDKIIEVPFIISKSSSLDKYDFENIRVYIAPPCNEINDSDDFVDVSVNFRKSCSRVEVSAPLDNWVFNRGEAYAKDSEGNVTKARGMALSIGILYSSKSIL